MKGNKVKGQVKKENYYDIVFRTYYQEALLNIVLIILSSCVVYFFCRLYALESWKCILIVAFITLLLIVISCNKGLRVLFDIKKYCIESKRIAVKSCKVEQRWYDYLVQNKKRYDKTWIELSFPKEYQVSRCKVFYDSEKGEDFIRLLLTQNSYIKLCNYLYDAEVYKNNDKLKRSRKRVDHELILDVKYYKNSKIVCEIKPVQGSKYENEDSEFLRNILNLD